jgi:hypothetical protein
LIQEGIVRPTIAEVARRAAVSERAVFNHFKNMEALRAAAVTLSGPVRSAAAGAANFAHSTSGASINDLRSRASSAARGRHAVPAGRQHV